MGVQGRLPRRHLHSLPKYSETYYAQAPLQVLGTEQGTRDKPKRRSPLVGENLGEKFRREGGPGSQEGLARPWDRGTEMRVTLRTPGEEREAWGSHSSQENGTALTGLALCPHPCGRRH